MIILIDIVAVILVLALIVYFVVLFVNRSEEETKRVAREWARHEKIEREFKEALESGSYKKLKTFSLMYGEELSEEQRESLETMLAEMYFRLFDQG